MDTNVNFNLNIDDGTSSVENNVAPVKTDR